MAMEAVPYTFCGVLALIVGGVNWVIARRMEASERERGWTEFGNLSSFFGSASGWRSPSLRHAFCLVWVLRPTLAMPIPGDLGRL